MGFVRWEEKVILNEKGKRLVYYYLIKEVMNLKKKTKVLAVVGEERSLRHMTYAMTPEFQMITSSNLRWKSKRDLVDWLDSFVSDSVPSTSLPSDDGYSDEEETLPNTILVSKGLSSGNMGHVSKEFSWLGSAWDCKKKRKHYRSFCRNGVTISVHDFVYVMGEAFRRLVAYVEDLFEDSKSNKMVALRWFHKVDEIGNIDLPSDVNDKEIFFSLCRQEFSIECIDGLAAVLNTQDFDKFQNEAKHRVSPWVPHLCRRKIENDVVMPFDITKVQGYWSQELLRSMYATPDTSLKLRLKITNKNCLNGEDISLSKSSGTDDNRGERHVRSPFLRKELLKQRLSEQQKHLQPGCQVEVLSQDSGIRGCWFRCVVLKRHHDKVKVRYQDLQDAEETGNLEEWVLASRIASPDIMGIRLCGRPMVRPYPTDNINSKVLWNIDVGSVVDAWWHDGWWEGIIIRNGFEGSFYIYFPGEKQLSTFNLVDLRPSQEWVGNKWHHIKNYQEVASSILFDIGRDDQRSLSIDKELPIQSLETRVEANKISVEGLWKWNQSVKRKRKRRSPRNLGKKRFKCESYRSNRSPDEEEAASNACEKSSLKNGLSSVDHDNCKIEENVHVKCKIKRNDDDNGKIKGNDHDKSKIEGNYHDMCKITGNDHDMCLMEGNDHDNCKIEGNRSNMLAAPMVVF